MDVMVSALQYDQEDLGVISHNQNENHKIKVKQGTIMPRQDIVVCTGKIMMVENLQHR